MYPSLTGSKCKPSDFSLDSERLCAKLQAELPDSFIHIRLTENVDRTQLYNSVKCQV